MGKIAQLAGLPGAVLHSFNTHGNVILNHHPQVSEFDKAISERDLVVNEANKCKEKIEMAHRLIDALGANGLIWESSVELLSEQLAFIPGDVLVACAFASYCGVFGKEFRGKAIESFCECLERLQVPLSPNGLDPLLTLTTEAQLAVWQSQGLPSDRVSSENGAIISCSQRWCLMVDPQLQGIGWVKAKYEFGGGLQQSGGKKTSGGFVSVRLSNPRFVNVFEQAVVNGSVVLLENVGEVIDAVLQPVISRNYTVKKTAVASLSPSKSSGAPTATKYLKLGDKDLKLHAGFHLVGLNMKILAIRDRFFKNVSTIFEFINFLHPQIIQTKLSNPHYPPETQAETTVVNFSVTEDGLEDQLLFLAVRWVCLFFTIFERNLTAIGTFYISKSESETQT